MKFSQELYQEPGMNATGIQVPDEIVTALGAGKRPPVTVTFNNFTYRTTVAPMGGAFWVPVSQDIRNRSGAKAGDLLDIEITLDTEPRTMEPPEDLAAAMELAPGTRDSWNALAPSKQKAIVTNIEGTRNPETRARRVQKAIDQLTG